MTRVGGPQREFAIALALAIYALRIGGIVFAIGALLGAIENVVSGEVGNESAKFGGLLAENTGGNGVDREGRVAVAFGLVDGSIGGGVDDSIGAGFTNQLTDGFQAGEVTFHLVDRDDIAERRQGALELKAGLAVLAREEKLHAHAPYCLPTQFL